MAANCRAARREAGVWSVLVEHSTCECAGNKPVKWVGHVGVVAGVVVKLRGCRLAYGIGTTPATMMPAFSREAILTENSKLPPSSVG